MLPLRRHELKKQGHICPGVAAELALQQISPNGRLLQQTGSVV